jgi:hypothetical protein
MQIKVGMIAKDYKRGFEIIYRIASVNELSKVVELKFIKQVKLK